MLVKLRDERWAHVAGNKVTSSNGPRRKSRIQQDLRSERLQDPHDVSIKVT